MRSGDPLIAKSSKTWTSENKVWGSPVQRSLPELAEGNAPQFVQPAADNGLLDTSRHKASVEGPLSAEMNAFRKPASDFDNAFYGIRPQVSKGWKPT